MVVEKGKIMARPVYNYNEVQQREEFDMLKAPIQETESEVDYLTEEEKIEEAIEAIKEVASDFESEPIDKDLLEGTIYKCNLINVRSEPSTTSEIITTLKAGAKVVVGDVVDEWVSITTQMGVEGYCLKDYVEV